MGGFPRWTDADVQAFEERHAVGTKAGLATGLGLYTGQARQDAIAMSEQHISREYDPELGIGRNSARAGNKGKPISPIALEAVKRLDALFAIEREICGRTVAERYAVRQQKSKPLFDEMHEWLTTVRATHSHSSEVLAAAKAKIGI